MTQISANSVLLLNTAYMKKKWQMSKQSKPVSEAELRLRWERMWESCPYKKKEIDMKIRRIRGKETDE